MSQNSSVIDIDKFKAILAKYGQTISSITLSDDENRKKLQDEIYVYLETHPDMIYTEVRDYFLDRRKQIYETAIAGALVSTN